MRKKSVYYFLAFIIPILIMLIVFKKMTIYPFGELSLLHMDLWGQYFPMLLEQYGNRLSFDSSLYSWNGGLGFNLYAQSAYYTNSIFNYILLLFSKEHLIDALDFLILLKFGLSSLTFSLFLNAKYKELTLISVVFSVAYALSGYTLAFINQIMWFDAVVFFPLIIMGLEKLVNEQKPLLFTFTLALTMVTSFYISFSICLFLVLYFILCMLQKVESWDFQTIKSDTFRFILYAFLAAGMASFVLLPVYATIQTTVASTLAVPTEVKLYHAFTQYIAHLLPTARLSLVYGVPNLFSGAFVLILIPLFISNQQIGNKRKVALLSLIGVLYFSMNLNILDYVWHGFHFPNQLPGRWSFMFTFILAITSIETLIHPEGLTRKGILIALFNVLFILSLIKVIPEMQRVSDKAVHLSMIGMMVYAAFMILLISDSNEKRKKFIIISLSAVMLFDIGIHAVTVVPRDSTANSTELFQHADQQLGKIVPQYESGEDELYRMEIMPIWTYNPGQVYGYKGLSYYASTMTGAAFDFYEALGFRVYAPNVSTSYNPYSPVMNALLNIKYVIDRNQSLDAIGFEKVETIDGYDILENKYDLPFAFMADYDLAKVKLDGTSYLENQEKLLSAAIGREVDVFKPIEPTAVQMNAVNCEIVTDAAWDNQYYLRVDKTVPVELTFTYVAEKEAYVFFEQNFKAGTMTVSANGKTQKNDVLNDVVKEIGLIKAGDTAVVSIKADKVDVGLWGMQFYTFDQETFDACYETLKESPVENIQFDTTLVTGTINPKKAGLLYTTIPYDKGWQVKSNGNTLDVYKTANYLIAVDLKSGQQTLEFRYRVPGLLLGSIFSVISLMVVVVLWRLKFKGL